jgi:hypothetical protein
MSESDLLQMAEAFFCRGMATGYASGAEATPIPGEMGWKRYEYREGDLYLEDRYYVDSTSGKSVGETRIYHQNRLIWIMVYGGSYKKEAIPCLKAALMLNYTAGRFYAGRGRASQMRGYQYNIRSIAGPNSFSHFSAHESIMHSVKQSGAGSYLESDGNHDVWGMALI